MFIISNMLALELAALVLDCGAQLVEVGRHLGEAYSKLQQLITNML